jgi:hypothetical protein
VIACYDTGDENMTPLWGGYVTDRSRGDDADNVTLAVATIEGYFDRRYVRNATFASTGQNSIVETLLNSYVVDGTRPGIPLTIVKVDGNGYPRDRHYFDTDDATVYARLTELMGVQGGPEWKTEWQWTANGTKIVPVLTVGTRLGKTASNASPAVPFAMPGSVTSFQLSESYSQGHGANAVTAFASGQGDTRPQSPEQYATDFGGAPQYEFRWSPSTSISDVFTLTGYAQQAVGIMNAGSKPVSLRAMRDTAPRFGTDWVLGDDIFYDLTHPILPLGLTGSGRAVAYELYLDEIAPILATVDEPVSA